MNSGVPDLAKINRVVDFLNQSGEFEDLTWESSPLTGLVMLATGDFDHGRIRKHFERRIQPKADTEGWEVNNDIAYLTGTGAERTPDMYVAVPELLAPTSGGHAESMSGVLMTLEVTSTNRSNDFEKVADYGRSGVPVYVLVDRKKHEILVYSDPGQNGYASAPEVYMAGEVVKIPAPIGVDVETGTIAHLIK